MYIFGCKVSDYGLDSRQASIFGDSDEGNQDSELIVISIPE
jgi:hypothetical protein